MVPHPSPEIQRISIPGMSRHVHFCLRSVATLLVASLSEHCVEKTLEGAKVGSLLFMRAVHALTVEIHLSDNRMTGTIPTKLGNMSSLGKLYNLFAL